MGILGFLFAAARLLFPSEAFVVTPTAADHPWPGQHVDAVHGSVDLTDVGELAVEVSNRLDRVLHVTLSVKSRALQGRSPGGGIALAPRAAGVIRCDLRPEPWRLDAPLKFAGMNGYPIAPGTGSNLFDLREVTSLHVFAARGTAPDSFEVRRVTVQDAVPREVVTYEAKTFFPFVDRYGQFSHGDWPGKVHGDADLASAREAEESWLTANANGPAADRNRWGGWANGPRLAATGFFRTEKVDGVWWLVDPDGRLFWSHGVDCVEPGWSATGVGFREKYFESIPPRDDPAFGRFWGEVRRKAAHGFYADTNHVPYATYDFVAANVLRKYGANGMMHSAGLAHRRLRAWGLNTIANWSSPLVWKLRRTPYTVTLNTHGAPRRAGSKGWWGPLPDPENPEFERILRTRVRELAKVMQNDPWCIGVFVDNELSWNGLPDLASVAEVYFATVARVVHEELPNHLYLGSRIAWGTEDVYRAAARHCDVVSVNVYARHFDRDLPEGSVDRPMIIGEFHFGALDRGLFHTGLVATRDQSARAKAYREYVESCLDHPRVVGAHWFQWRDQPLAGRADGENYQIGFLTGTDAPYPELVESARAVAREMYQRRKSQEKGERNSGQ